MAHERGRAGRIEQATDAGLTQLPRGFLRGAFAGANAVDHDLDPANRDQAMATLRRHAERLLGRQAPPIAENAECLPAAVRLPPTPVADFPNFRHLSANGDGKSQTHGVELVEKILETR